jgi:hypothetical protein
MPEAWIELLFSMDVVHYYSYEYVVAPDGESFIVRAQGDLDCDGNWSKIELHGEIQNAKIVLDRTFHSKNELE